MRRFHLQSAVVFLLFVSGFTNGGCSCGPGRKTEDAGIDAEIDADVSSDGGEDAGPDSGSDAGPDSGVDGGPDGGVGVTLIHRNVAGGTTSSSASYRLVRTNGRGARGSSMNFSQRDAVHGGQR